MFVRSALLLTLQVVRLRIRAHDRHKIESKGRIHR